MTTKRLFFQICFLLCALTLFAADDVRVWLKYSKQDLQTLQKIDNRIRAGFYEEALVLIESARKKNAGKPLEALATLRKAKLRFVNLQFSAAEKNVLETIRLSQTLAAEEQEMVQLSLMAYFCFTKELLRADSVRTALKNTPNLDYTLERNYAQALLSAGLGNFDAAMKFLERVSIDTVRMGKIPPVDYELRIQAHLLRAHCLAESGKHAEADTVYSKISVMDKTPDYWYWKSCIATGKASNLMAQKKFNEAIPALVSVVGISESSPYAYEYLNASYALIECYYRAGNTLNGNNYLRRLQQVSLRSAAKNELADVVYESSYALSLILKGEFSTAEYRLSKAVSGVSGLNGSITGLRVYDLYRESFSKTGKVKELKNLIVELGLNAQRRSGVNSLEFHRRKLQEAMIASSFNGEYFSSLNLFRKHYDAGLHFMLSQHAQERLIYLYAFSESFLSTDFADSASIRLESAMKISAYNYSENSAEFLYAKARYTDGLLQDGNYALAVPLLQSLNAQHEPIKNGSLALQEKFYLLLADLNKIPGEFELSKRYLSKALSLQHKRIVPDFMLLAEAEEQYAFLYFQSSNFYKADRALERAMKLKKTYLSAESPLLIPTLQQLATLKIATGDFVKADQYLTPLEKITLASVGQESLKNAEYRLLLAEYLVSISDYKRAQKEIETANRIALQKLGENHLFRAEILMELAHVLNMLHAPETEIKGRYDDALRVTENALGKSNPLYVRVNTAYAEWMIGALQAEQALKKIEEAELFWKEKYGNESAPLAQLLEMKGDAARALNKQETALQYYSTGSEMLASLFNDQHPNYTRVVGKQARVLYDLGKYEESLALMDKIVPVFLNFTEHHFPLLSFRQKAVYWNTIKEEFEFYNNLAFVSRLSSPPLWEKAWNNTLATKAILLSSGTKLLNQIYSSGDTVLIASYNKWVAAREQLISVMSLSKKEQEELGLSKSAIEADIEQIEREMSTRSAAFAEKKKTKPVRWMQLKDVLTEDELALEIIRFRKYQKGFLDSSVYVGIQTGAGSVNPEIAILMNGYQLEKRYLKYYRNSTIGRSHDEYSYDMYWKPLKKMIPDGKRVYVSTDGVYAQLNIEMLRLPDGTYPIDHNEFVYVSTVKDLMQLTVQKGNKAKRGDESYLICGNPKFYSEEYKGDERNIADLPGTEKEIGVIKVLLDSAGKVSTVLSSVHLNEDTLKNMLNPRVLHVATHGFFMEQKQSNKDELANNPMLNSGILLSEAGDILDNKLNPYINQKDGVLTAFEAMDMQLDNTDLVILSACETGRGEVEAGEGVYGLQRSFLMAGSKAVIVSLFKVNDEVTQKLMSLFYSKWLQSGDKERAFNEAKKEIKRQYPDPIFWGAFVMIEGKPMRSQVKEQAKR